MEVHDSESSLAPPKQDLHLIYTGARLFGFSSTFTLLNSGIDR